MNPRDTAAALEDEFNERYRPTTTNNFGSSTPVKETMRCRPCGVSWNGDDPCWCCGEERKPAGHVAIDVGMSYHGSWGLPENFDTLVDLFD